MKFGPRKWAEVYPRIRSVQINSRNTKKNCKYNDFWQKPFLLNKESNFIIYNNELNK